MKIELKLYASLARHMPEGTVGNPHAVVVKEGTTVQHLLETLEVPKESVKLVFVNGIHAQGDKILKEGDRVGIFPAVAGG